MEIYSHLPSLIGIIQLGINKVGQGNIVATFKDGTTGQIPSYIYDEWYLTCGSVVDVNHPMEWAYTAGIPKGVFGATTDMTVDCAGLSVTFTNGATRSAAPATDVWGNVASAFTTMASGTTSAAPLTVSVASLQLLERLYIASFSRMAGMQRSCHSSTTAFQHQSQSVSGISLHALPERKRGFPVLGERWLRLHVTQALVPSRQQARCQPCRKRCRSCASSPRTIRTILPR